MQKFLRLIAVLIMVPVLWQPAPAVAQSLDPTFTASSLYAPGRVYSAVEQPDGKRVVVGGFSRVNGAATGSVVRFNADGTLDAVFQQNIGTPLSVARASLLSNGQILLTSFAGSITAGGITQNNLLRLNTDGTGDATLNSGSGAQKAGRIGRLSYALPLPNGQMLVVGDFDHFNGVSANGIARLNASGSVDATFYSGQGFSRGPDTIVPLPNGKFLVGGYFSSYNGISCGALVRLNADGSFDSTFKANSPNGQIPNIVVQPDGRILIAGYLPLTGSNTSIGLARLQPDGSYDNSFTPPAAFSPFSVYSFFGSAIELQADGKLLVISQPGVSSGNGVARVARLNPNGTLDASFQVGTGPNNLPESLTLLASGKVLVSGSFTNFSGTTDRTLIQLTSTGVIDPSFQPLVQNAGSVMAVVQQPDGKLVVGGDFSEINGQTVRRLARFGPNGALDGTFSTGNTLDTRVAALALQPDGRILAGAQSVLQRFLTTGSPDNSFSAPNFTGSNLTHLLLQPDGRVLVGGTYMLINGSNVTPSFLRLLPDGSRDVSFAPSNSSTAGGASYFRAMVLQPNGKLLVAGSYLVTSGNTPNQTVLRLESTGALDASFTSVAFTNPYINLGANVLALQPDGKVVVGGEFTAVNGTPRVNVARLNADGTHDVGFVPPLLTGPVNTLQLQPNNRVLLGGHFTGAGLPDNLARLLPTGQADASFGPTVVPDNTVYSLLIQADGKIIVAGFFTTLSGQSSPALARITATNVLHVNAPRAVADRTEAWPVPAHATLNVAPDPTAHPQALDLLDVLGRPVLHRTLTGGAPATMAVGTLAPGSYLLRVTYAEGAVVRRIQVQ